MGKTKIGLEFQFWGPGTPKFKFGGFKIFFALKIFLGYPIFGILTPKSVKIIILVIENMTKIECWKFALKILHKSPNFCPKYPQIKIWGGQKYFLSSKYFWGTPF